MINKISHSNFNNWIDTLIEEKEIDLNHIFTVSGEYNEHIIEVSNVIQHMKQNFNEEDKYKCYDKLVKIDFKNGNIYHFLGFVAQFMAIKLDEQIGGVI